MKNNYFFLFFLLLSALLNAQTAQLEDHWWVPNSNVRTIVKDGNIVYLGGDFTYIGPNTPYGASIDAATSAPDTSFAKPNGAVLTTVPDGAGGWYIGGNFTNVGGEPRNYIARINSDGSVHPWNPNADNIINTLIVSGNTVYAGGYFTNIGGQSRNRIASIDALTGLATSWNPDVDNSVITLAISGNIVYASGNFSAVGGQARNKIAAIDISTGTVTSWNPNPDGGVGPITASGNTIYVGGNFTTISGQARNGLAAFNASTGSLTTWNPNVTYGVFNPSIATIAVNSNTIYIGGMFLSISGQARNNIAALDASTGLATAWNPNANGNINTLVTNGTTVYAGGGFTSIGGQPRNYIAALDATTGQPTAWNPNASSSINTLALNGSTIYAGGGFTSIGGQARNYIAALDATTGQLTAWNPSASSTVRAITVNGNTVYAGGDFFNIGGQSRSLLAALDATTGLATSWNPGASNSVFTLAVEGNTVYAGGYFNNIGGQPRNYLAALDTTTGLATSWNPNVNNGVLTVVVDGNIVYAGGYFTSLGGQTRNYLASIDITTGLPTSWDPNANGFVYTINVNSNIVYVGGTFTGIGGQARNRLAALDASTGLATSWNPNPNSGVLASAVNGNGIYTGGNFSSIGGQSRNRLAAIDTTTGNASAWNPNLNGSVYALAVDGSKIYVGGNFSTVGAQVLNRFAVFNSCTLTASAGTQVNVLCNGNATGEATVTAMGGTGAYTYSWNTTPAQTTATATNLATGTYIATVTDANNCTATQSFTITEPAVLTASAGAQTNVLCHGQATGTATVTATGGTGVYTYIWDTTPVQTTATATGLAAGTYNVTVTDGNGCSKTQSFTITEPTVLTASVGTQINVLCNSNTTGEATVNATGGTGVYTYSWNTTPVQTTATATNLAAGTYIATVTDANNCTSAQSFTITEPTALTASAGTQVDVLCQGAATGEATVNVTGGTGAYTYSWNTNPAQTTATATNLAAGTYIATVTDANNCTTTQSFTITEPATAMALTPNITQTDVLCNGQATGSATVAVTGGTGAYTYLWSNGGTANTITGLVAGTYTVDVTDANGCILSNSFTITQPTVLVATAGPQTNVLCYGNATGEATVNATGGTGAYSYNWSPSGGTAATATGLTAGTYTVTVYDANQCQTTQSFTITQPAQPLSMTPNTSQTNVSCFGGANGTASMAVTGGTSPYTYLWSNGQTNAIATGLVAGTYTVTATDANGCTIANSYTITEPTALIATAGSQMNITCFGAANGSATVNATGGTGAYSYSWNTTPVQTTATATNLAPGNYIATVTDANNCTATQSFTITEPQQLTAVINNSTNILCYGAATGSASVSAAGGTSSYTYLWNNGQTTATATALTAGNYSVIVTDANGCQANANVTITQPAAALVATAGAQTNLICNGNTNGSATVNVTGGTGTYTYSWNTNPVQTTATATGLAAGTYTVTVYDANQCQTTHSFTITQPAAVAGYFTIVNSDCHATGSATIHATGGTAPYTYLWSNGNTMPNLLNALPETYTVTVTDANGCSNVLSATIYGTTPITVTSAPQSVTIDGGETVIFTVEAQNVAYYQWQVSTNGGQTFSNLNAGGSIPGYNGVATPTLTITNAYQVLDGYQYRVILMQQNGCYILSDAAILTVNAPIVGIDETTKPEVSIYPNPASTEVFVKIPDFGAYKNIALSIYDLNGRLVKNENNITSDEYKIDVTGLESGVYIITITTDKGKMDKKLIVNKKP